MFFGRKLFLQLYWELLEPHWFSLAFYYPSMMYCHYKCQRCSHIYHSCETHPSSGWTLQAILWNLNPVRDTIAMMSIKKDDPSLFVTVWIIIRLQFIFKLTNKLTLFRRIHKSIIIKQHGRWQCIVIQKSFGVKTSFLSDFDWSLSHVHFSDHILCSWLMTYVCSLNRVIQFQGFADYPLLFNVSMLYIERLFK